MAKLTQYEIQIYLDDGRVFFYHVDSASRAREHIAAIATSGYRHNDGKIFEHYPPHRIMKIKTSSIPTMYPDKTRGT